VADRKTNFCHCTMPGAYEALTLSAGEKHQALCWIDRSGLHSEGMIFTTERCPAILDSRQESREEHDGAITDSGSGKES